MTTGIGCTVYANGVRIADGSPGDDPNDPNALSGLEITWGRETTVDQPATSQCAFDIADPPGGGSFVDRLRTGTPIDVVATGDIYPDPTVSTWPDPGFESGILPGTVAVNASATIGTGRPASGIYALRMRPRDAGRRASVVIGPAPFAAPGTDPDAWDEIPTTDAGQTWSLSASVWAPPGATVVLKPVIFPGPYASGYTVLNSPQTSIQGTGAYVVTDPIMFQPPVSNAWVGVQVSTFPTGPAWDDLDPAWTWDMLPTVLPDPLWSWDDYGDVWVDDVTVLAPEEGVTSEVLVFSGRISSLQTTWDNGPLVKVAAVDFTADLENVQVGEEPWLVEPMGDRFQTILNSVAASSAIDVTVDMDPSAAAPLVSWRDVDSQPAAGLLEELASSVDAVMWSATHQVTGPYLQVEDPRNRPSQSFLVMGDDGLVIVIPNPGIAGALVVSACDVLRDDVTWTQDTQDVMTRASVTWKEQGVDDEGLTTTTDRTVTVIDTNAEASLGARSISLTSELQSEADATTVANQLLERTSSNDWRLSGLVIDDYELTDTTDDDVTNMLTLLDGTSRNGLPISLTELPLWSPSGDVAAVYLEGGSYAFEDGFWMLDLTVSNSTALGRSLTWDELAEDPAGIGSATWTWDQFDPGVSWNDLRGAGFPTPEPPPNSN